MLNDFCAEWNSLFPNHLSNKVTGKVIISEFGEQAKNKTLEITCSEALSFPSKHFDSYNLFGALTEKNCDGALLLNNNDGTYDFVYVEMKSRFGPREVDKAKVQIVETRTKMLSLFRMMKKYPSLPIKRVYGVIETLTLDNDQIVWWSKQQLLPDEKMNFGEKLIKYSVVNEPTGCKGELDAPPQMDFRLVFSDNPNYVISSHDIQC